MGEGYHNFHHTFPTDYRNGVHRYEYDPTKWILSGFSVVGLAKNLIRTPEPAILEAKRRMQAKRAEAGRKIYMHAGEKRGLERGILESFDS